MALGIVKYFCDRPSQPIGVIWFAVSCPGLRSLAATIVIKAVRYNLVKRIYMVRKCVY